MLKRFISINLKRYLGIALTFILFINFNFIGAKQAAVTEKITKTCHSLKQERGSVNAHHAQQLFKGLIDQDEKLAFLIKEVIAYGHMQEKTDDELVEATMLVLVDYAQQGGPSWLRSLWKNFSLRQAYINHAIFKRVTVMHQETTDWFSAWKTSIKRSWWAFKSMMWVKQMAYLPHVVLAVTAIGVAQKAFSAYKVLSWLMPLVGLA